MLPRNLTRSLRQLPHKKDACNVWSCRCGIQPSSHHFFTSTRAQAVRKAPSTRGSNKPIPVAGTDPNLIRQLKERARGDEERETNNEARHGKIMKAYADGLFSMPADRVDEFMQAFAALQTNFQLRIGAPAPETFHRLVEAAGATERDLVYLCMMLIQNKQVESERYWGRKLIDWLSAAGYVEATIRILNNALIQAKNFPAMLRQQSINVERGRLQKIAREQKHSRAMVLEGKIAYHLGDTDAALKWWWQAIEGAVAKSKHFLALRATGEQTVDDMAGLDRSDLSTPWIELIEAHFERSLTAGKNEWKECEKAIKIGLEQDDPTAFYYAATYYKQRNEDGSHMPTSEWLYRMTKAAASGVPKAAYELGVYYAESGWKYIEDEPPENLKPTAFDTHPGESVDDSAWGRVRQWLSPSKAPEAKAQDDVFHTATWPPTPEERYKLAMEWLDVAIRYTYVPASLYKAKLYMQETLWAGAQAPKEALDLSPKRYLYASKGEELDAYSTGDLKTHELPEDTKDPPNPVYSLALAKQHLLEIFLAREAVFSRDMAMQRASKERRDADWDDFEITNTEKLGHISKYLENAEVYGQWEKESKVLYEEAASICEHKGWTLHDHQGALWYKAGQGGLEYQEKPVGHRKIPR
jgi:hypothetical protein